MISSYQRSRSKHAPGFHSLRPVPRRDLKTGFVVQEKFSSALVAGIRIPSTDEWSHRERVDAWSHAVTPCIPPRKRPRKHFVPCRAPHAPCRSRRRRGAGLDAPPPSAPRDSPKVRRPKPTARAKIPRPTIVLRPTRVHGPEPPTDAPWQTCRGRWSPAVQCCPHPPPARSAAAARHQ
jgi:hypothetical protein